MKIVLIVSGGIAAYKSVLLLREYRKKGHDVQIVMTASAKQFVAPLTFQALSGHPVRDSLFDAEQEAGMDHIALARWPDVIVVAPATANRIAKMRMGLADDLASTLLLATDKPILLAPAMNRLMWQHPATQENIAILKARGIHIITPAEGEQACGEVGPGRMEEPEVIAQSTQQLLSSMQSPRSEFWAQQMVLISAGPTFEDLDPVRFIGNRSSGKMGFAIAEQAQKLGANVRLISGPVQLATPEGVERIDVRSALQMFSAVQSHYASASVFISAAAVADFRVAEMQSHKIKKQSDQDAMQISLVKNPDIVAWVAQQLDKPFVVGFAAETQNVEAYARDKLQRKGLDMICANQVGANLGFDQNENSLTLMSEHRTVPLQQSSKTQQAQALLEFIEQQLTQ